MIHYEGGDQVSNNLNVIFGAGFPRQVQNKKVQGTIADSIIHVCPLSTYTGSLKYPSMFNQVMDYCLANLPIDTSKTEYDMYKYVCITGIGQGASDAWDNLAWYTTGNGELKYVGKISHAVFMSIPNLYPAPEAFVNYQYTDTKFFHEQNTNPCCQYQPAQAMHNTLADMDYTISTFTMFTMANNGFNNLTWDSMYSPLSTDTTLNIYKWLISSKPKPLPVASNKIKVYESSLYDLSGRLLHKDRPFNYFDGFETVDPKNGDVAFEPQTIMSELGKPKPVRGDTTNPIPASGRDASYFYGASNRSLAYGGYYFPGKRGRCIIVDLNNDPSVKHALITHGKKYNITDIYGWESNFEEGDSLYFYNFDKVIEESDLRKIPFMINRPDSTLKPFAVLTTRGGTAGAGAGIWRSVSGITDSMRYIMIRNTLQQRSGYTSTAFFNELVFYGSPVNEAVQPPTGYNGPLPTQKTLWDKAGVNTGVDINTDVMGIVKNIRQYVNTDWYDTDTAAATKYKQLFNANLYPGYEGWSAYWPQHGHNHWLAVFGASKRAGLEMNASVRNNIDTPYAEPGDWLHYISHGRMFYQFAYKWGNNKSLDGSKYRWFNDAAIPGYALNWYSHIELGNEDDAYEPPAVTAAKLVMAVNGNSKYLGDTLGIRNADPGMKIVYAGQTFPDTFRIRTAMFLAYAMMKDTSARLFDVFSYHNYSVALDTVSGIVGPTYEEQVGNGGLIPERNNWYNKCNAMAKFLWKITGDTAIKVWNTEYGFDNFSIRSTTVDQLVAGWTTTAVPRIAGYDSVQSKSISIMRMDLIMAASLLDGFMEYNIHNSNLDETNNVYLNFYTCGWGGKDYALSVKFPNYYAKKWMYERLGQYAVDSVLSKDGTGLWLIKWRKKNDADSIMYSIWKGSENGSTLTYNGEKIEGITNGSVTKEVYNFSKQTADVTNVAPKDAYDITVTEMPVFYFTKKTK